MRTLQITRTVDDDSILRLGIPTEDAGDEIEVVVVLESRLTTMRSTWREALGKPGVVVPSWRNLLVIKDWETEEPPGSITL